MKESEKQILLICQEECAEVTQAISKVFRFGMDGEHDGRTNRQRLIEEIGDLLCMIDLMTERNILDDDAVHRAVIQKRNKLMTWSDIFDDKSQTVN